MSHPEQHFRRTWELAAPPAALWPLISDTDRFNRDCGYPPVTAVPLPDAPRRVVTNTRRLRASVLGVAVEWDESAFEWVAPRRFAVQRNYTRGPLRQMCVACELRPGASGGTTLIYDIRATAAGAVWRLALPLALGVIAARRMDRVIRRYDELALAGVSAARVARRPTLASGGRVRLADVSRRLVVEQRQPEQLVDRLATFLTSADDISASRIRAYALADEWNEDRRGTLELCLHATRAGALNLSWDLLCPHCRGAQNRAASLQAIPAEAHCPSCGIDFTTEFDRSVELTFRPNPLIRETVRRQFCIGGPQVTPHMLARQELAPETAHSLPLSIAPGRYRVRSEPEGMSVPFRVVERGGTEALTLVLGEIRSDEPAVAPTAELTLRNPTNQPRRAIIEHLAWTDQATTAAEATSLQLFRDLFAREVLRPGEQIAVGAITLVFTDLKNSTELYQRIGDAPAFGRVLSHFDVLREAVTRHGGAVVKTMGDAVMAVFPRPFQAVSALLEAQRQLAAAATSPHAAGAAPKLALKVGVHVGPCLAITQNERLDYFGTAVNTAARLCAQSTGRDLVISRAVATDPEVAGLLERADGVRATAERVVLKGFGDVPFEIQRVASKMAAT